MFMNGATSANPPGGGRTSDTWRVKAPAARAAGAVTRLGARWFVGNARRERRLRAGRLSQIGLRQDVGRRDLRVARQRDGVARDAVRTLVRCVGMRVGGVRAAVVIGMRCGIVMVRGMVMRCGMRGMTCMRLRHRRLHGGLRCSAERHRRRRIPLEGYGEHHQPQQEHANAGHPAILSAVRCPITESPCPPYSSPSAESRSRAAWPC